MDDTYRKAYEQQRRNAQRRGIAWQLTYEQWREWWGSDIVNRGVRPWNLGMNRIADSGPYALGNIRKGTPKDNGRTRSAVRQNRASELRRAQWLALEPQRTMEPPDPEPEYAELGYATVADRYEWI